MSITLQKSFKAIKLSIVHEDDFGPFFAVSQRQVTCNKASVEPEVQQHQPLLLGLKDHTLQLGLT